ncbi:gluconokinase isoform X2 [Senna tora]|uniref:Gluconokinase n=1 Tax=Senna tora TaxID=362788 RepID=A0A834TSG8_9FABA|nr:gluconokinase isoform X2 [Senna tora]
MLAMEKKYTYLDADDFHPQSNKDKMHMGIPLSEEDRIPWLKSLRDVLREYSANRKGVVLSCSALKKQYREILRSADPNYKLGSYVSSISFILLDAPAEVLRIRLQKRAAEGNHFMPASLLQSQLDLLEIEESEGVLKVDATSSPETIVHTIQKMLQF